MDILEISKIMMDKQFTQEERESMMISWLNNGERNEFKDFMEAIILISFYKIYSEARQNGK